MNILIANDDGIHAQGIKELVSFLRDLGDVYVCAPSQERSGVGHGITVFQPLTLKEEEFSGAVKAYACSGTPADCVKLGIRTLEAQGIHIDVVFSGINHGANLGTDTLYSGTVSAAVEGLLCGKLSVAVSSIGYPPKHFESCRQVVRDVAERCRSLLHERMVININVPDVAEQDLAGTKVTSLGVREYSEAFAPQTGDNGEVVYKYTGLPMDRKDSPEGLDVTEYRKNFITITPLGFDLTNYDKLNMLKGWYPEPSETEEENMKVKRITKENAVLLLIDFQEKLMPNMVEKEALEKAVVNMTKGCRAMGLPVIVTQQYTKGIGPTIASVDEALTMELSNAEASSYEPIEKSSFSAVRNEEFMKALEATGRKTVIVAGIESHICVAQTVIDLLELGYTVFVAGDCVSSRKASDIACGRRRMKEAGAVFTSTEAVLFELVVDSKAPQFKEISRIIK